ncbi:MAG: glycosyltransferase family 9 protein [Deltaproteobacteria bacterium]|nr:glycosyltransferase family 9 protein [Deltaproteobacteria bacterium]
MPFKSIEPAATLVLFPGALGDLLCCWPALAALARQGPLTLAAHAAPASVLPAELGARLSIDRREFADLFADAPLAPATRALLGGFARVESFTGHGAAGFAERLAAASRTRPAIHPFRAMRHGEHASAYYARCLRVAIDCTRLPVAADAAAWSAELWRQRRLGPRVLVIHPGSGAAPKNWQGMADAARAWRAAGGAVLALAGPAELERAIDLPADLTLRDAPLPRVAAVLQRAARYLGNDSGISHLAGLVGARGVALFGNSDPDTWRPLGGLRVEHAPAACPSCGPDVFCQHRLPLRRVMAALAAD